MPHDFPDQPEPPGRARIGITPDDVGRRVSVRRIIGVEGNRPVFTDVIGVLESWDGGELLVRDRHGTAVAIREAVLVAGRKVPPPPPRRERGHEARGGA